VWGDDYRRIGRCESDYHTLAGTVRVMRTVCRKAERNGDTLDPVSVRAGVVADGWFATVQVARVPGRPHGGRRHRGPPPAQRSPDRAKSVRPSGRRRSPPPVDNHQPRRAPITMPLDGPITMRRND
jgi:hypothetical protein